MNRSHVQSTMYNMYKNESNRRERGRVTPGLKKNNIDEDLASTRRNAMSSTQPWIVLTAV